MSWVKDTVRGEGLCAAYQADKDAVITHVQCPTDESSGIETQPNEDGGDGDGQRRNDNHSDLAPMFDGNG